LRGQSTFIGKSFPADVYSSHGYLECFHLGGL